MSDPNNLEGPPPTPEERAAMARELDRVAPTPADKFRLMLGQRPTPRTGEWHGKCHSYHKNSKGRTLMEEAQLIERELAAAHEECDEQTRLIGMSWKRRAGLLAEIDRLKRWKSEQMAVESSWDPQAIEQELGLPLGSDIRPQILPAIVDLKRELAEAREEGEEQARLLGMSGEREAGLLAEIDRLKRELAETVACMRLAEAATIRALHERNEARGQRDRLAEELEDAEAALTALEGGTDDA